VQLGPEHWNALFAQLVLDGYLSAWPNRRARLGEENGERNLSPVDLFLELDELDRLHGLRRVEVGTLGRDVIGVVEDEDLSDIVLVGHSYGGMVISGVADRVPEKIASLVYLDAFVPEDGQSCLRCCRPTGVLSPCRARTGWWRR
jgi:hypothetical protein